MQDKVVAYQQAEQALKTKEAVLTEKKASVEMMEGVDEEALQAQLEALQKDSSDARWAHRKGEIQKRMIGRGRRVGSKYVSFFSLTLSKYVYFVIIFLS